MAFPISRRGTSEGRSLVYNSRDARDRCRELGFLGQSRERGTPFWSGYERQLLLGTRGSVNEARKEKSAKAIRLGS